MLAELMCRSGSSDLHRQAARELALRELAKPTLGATFVVKGLVYRVGLGAVEHGWFSQSMCGFRRVMS